MKTKKEILNKINFLESRIELYRNKKEKSQLQEYKRYCNKCINYYSGCVLALKWSIKDD